MKKKKKEKENQDIVTKEEKQVRRTGEQLYIDEVIPVIAFDEDLGVGIMEDGTFCDCFSIVCKDLNSVTKDQLLLDALTWDKIYKTYPGDLKIICFSFPADTKEQQEYLEHKIATTENPIFQNLLREKLEELESIHLSFLTREAALFFYAENATEYKNNFITLQTVLGRSAVPIVRNMDKEKKKQLFYKLCNKNLNR